MLRGQCCSLPQRIFLFIAILILTTSPSQSIPPPNTIQSDNRSSSVDIVGDAVSLAVSQLSETLRNTTSHNPSPQAAPQQKADDPAPPPVQHSEGHAALQSHRDAAAGVVSQQVHQPQSAQVAVQPAANDAQNHPADDAPSVVDDDSAHVRSDLVKLDCQIGRCAELESAFLAAIEGDSCRSVFVNGKCPAACVAAITQVTSDEMWKPCVAACQNEIVSGAADRWANFCSSRQETLIDQGKEAVKSLVGDGLTSGLQTKLLMQFFFAVMVLVVAVGYGYRRGAVSAQIAYRLQKRRLMGRKNSDINLPI